MLISHIGHAEFLIETEKGVRIVTDPYDGSCGYPLRQVRADVALVSHHHHDHDAVENVKGKPAVIDSAGTYTPEESVRITAVKGFHDDAGGTKRGETLLFLIEADGLRIVHLGDLGCLLNAEQAAALKNPDILMVPVGGFYTIDADQAAKTAETLGARIILPMHYKTVYNKSWPIDGPEPFLKQYAGADTAAEAEILRVTREDLECQPRVVLFKA